MVTSADSPDLVDPTAVVGRRMAGWMLDVALVAGTVLAVLLALGDSFERPGSATSLDLRLVDGDTAVFFRSTVAVVHAWEWAVAGAAAAVVAALFLVLLPGARGWTPGLLAAELRLVDADGHRPGLRRSIVRSAGWLVDVLPGVPLVGLVAMRFGRHHQRIGDRLARTYVVDRAFTGAPPTMPATVDTGGPLPVEFDPDEMADDEAAVETVTIERGVAQRAEASPEPAGADSADWAPTQGADSAPGVGPPDGIEPDHPVWDADRGRYVMWHSPSGRWATYDDESASWQPLPGDR